MPLGLGAYLPGQERKPRDLQHWRHRKSGGFELEP